MEIRHLFVWVVIAAMLFSCNGTNENEQQSLLEISKQELATALAERDQLLAFVKDVSAGLKQIKQLEYDMAVATSLPAENIGQTTRILADIACLKEKIQQRKTQLKELEIKLHKSTINNGELQDIIRALRVMMDSQIEEIEAHRQQLTTANEHIVFLNNTLDSLNTTISTVTDERNAAQVASIKFEDELNICYYVIATKTELKKHNILESGFLRKTKLLKGDFDKGYFRVGDKRNILSLPLDAIKVKILTNHPDASYELIDENGQKVIEIKDSELFWSLSNYLVVQKD